MINLSDILETIRMIQDECLDIRTITMGISLLDCIDSDIDKACEKVYKKITTCAKDLVKVGNEIEKEYGIPIINKRISVTPIAMISAACHQSPVKFAITMDKAAEAGGGNPPRPAASTLSAAIPRWCRRAFRRETKSLSSPFPKH